MDYKGEYIDETPRIKWVADDGITVFLHGGKMDLDHFIHTVSSELNPFIGKDYHVGFEFYDTDIGEEFRICLYKRVLETPEQTDARIAEQKRHIDARQLARAVEEDAAVKLLLERGYSIRKLDNL